MTTAITNLYLYFKGYKIDYPEKYLFLFFKKKG